MLTAYLFDKRRGKEIEGWAEGVGRLSKNQVLWIDLLDPSEDEERELRAALDLRDAEPLRLAGDVQAEIEQSETHIRISAVAVSTGESDPTRETVLIDCFVGHNLVVTAHQTKLAVVDDFRTLAEGGSELGALDAASFLATLLRVGRDELLASIRRGRIATRGIRRRGARQPRQRHRGADRTTGRDSRARRSSAPGTGPASRDFAR